MQIEKLLSFINKSGVIQDTGGTLLVVDDQLQVIFLNGVMLEEQVLPGNLLKCQNALCAVAGCGTHAHCSSCNLRSIVSGSMTRNEKCRGEASLLLDGNQELDVRVISTPMDIEGKKYAAVVLVDNSAKKRELMLERIFFHDMLNLSGAINGFLELMDPENTEEMLDLVKKLSQQLTDDMKAQRDLIYAQKGILKVDLKRTKARDLLTYICDSLQPMATEYNRVHVINNTLNDEEILVDKRLVHRILLNMFKNSAEAIQDGEVITLNACAKEGRVILSVHNSSVIPIQMRNDIFKYGNTTKGMGRGLGTYSMKLLGENYLNGKVWFTSEEGMGTEFFLSIPLYTE